MPIKWKIFRIINYLHLFLIILFIITVAMGAAEIEMDATLKIVTLTLMNFGFAVQILFSANNLLLLEKFYPEKLPGRAFSIYSRILFIFFILMLAIWLWACIEAINTEIINPDEFAEAEDLFLGQVVASAMSLLLILGIYLAWLHISLRKSIRRNFDHTLSGFLQPDQP